MAIQFSMMVEITSWAPTAAFIAPAIAPQKAPNSAAASSARVTCSGLLIEAKWVPTMIAPTMPTTYWPWPPMLNMPHR